MEDLNLSDDQVDLEEIIDAGRIMDLPQIAEVEEGKARDASPTDEHELKPFTASDEESIEFCVIDPIQ